MYIERRIQYIMMFGERNTRDQFIITDEIVSVWSMRHLLLTRSHLDIFSSVVVAKLS